ncbi:nucleotide sugar dehydrogenase [Azospirillum palustre]
MTDGSMGGSGTSQPASTGKAHATENALRIAAAGQNRQVVCVQGLGFVGAALATALASVRSAEDPVFFVIGVEAETAAGRAKVESINRGELPIASGDPEMTAAFAQAVEAGNFIATTDPVVYAAADVVVIDINLDVIRNGAPHVDFTGLRNAVATVGRHVRPGALVLVETTVPPGTCQHIIAPELARAMEARGLPADSVLLAHSYERVMPGRDYFSSIVSFWRVYAGDSEEAAEACRRFLERFIDVDTYPLRRLANTTESETAKVLENSYRAANIAFIDEWGRFAEEVGVNLFAVIDAIRDRPTHSNIRQPGFGVGGYCLTKDPLLAAIAARDIFGIPHLEFPVSTRAVTVNEAMPQASVNRLRKALGGSYRAKRLLMLGVSYRQDVGDTRHSPAEPFLTAVEAEGAMVDVHDPLVNLWSETGRNVASVLPSPVGYDAVVFTVAHESYAALSMEEWLGDSRPLIFDANHVLTNSQESALRQLGCRMVAIGRGDLWLVP